MPSRIVLKSCISDEKWEYQGMLSSQYTPDWGAIACIFYVTITTNSLSQTPGAYYIRNTGKSQPTFPGI